MAALVPNGDICALIFDTIFHLSFVLLSLKGLDQLQMAPLVPDDSLLRFLLFKDKFSRYSMRHFSSGISSAIKCYVYI